MKRAFALTVLLLLPACGTETTSPALDESSDKVTRPVDGAPLSTRGISASSVPRNLVGQLQASLGSSIIFDQGFKGVVRICYGNTTAGQNFADAFALLPGGGSVEEISVFSCSGPNAGTVHIKILGRFDGPTLYEADVTPESWTYVGSSVWPVYEVRVALPEVFAAAPGVTYWIGVSGNNATLSQIFLFTGGDGRTAIYQGTTSGGMIWGSQAFTLFGTTPDTDGDGVPDHQDAFPSDPSEWADTDGDGFGDNSDAFPADPKEWADTDGDGYGDNGDAFPADPGEWMDTDGDGHGDNGDAFPTDPSEWTDTDGDGFGDNSDAFPNSDLAPIIVIEGCVTGVANQMLPNGASFMDLIGAAAESAGNPGQFVSALTHLEAEWMKAGLISGKDKGAITSCAAGG